MIKPTSQLSELTGFELTLFWCDTDIYETQLHISVSVVCKISANAKLDCRSRGNSAVRWIILTIWSVTSAVYYNKVLHFSQTRDWCWHFPQLTNTYFTVVNECKWTQAWLYSHCYLCCKFRSFFSAIFLQFLCSTFLNFSKIFTGITVKPLYFPALKFYDFTLSSISTFHNFYFRNFKS